MINNRSKVDRNRSRIQGRSGVHLGSVVTFFLLGSNRIADLMRHLHITATKDTKKMQSTRPALERLSEPNTYGLRLPPWTALPQCGESCHPRVQPLDAR